MDIKKQIVGDRAEIQVIGRMDAYWAALLATALDDAVREGLHEISLDLSGVSFMSSAGIGVLVGCYKQLQAIRGSFHIASASRHVQDLIVRSGLKDLLRPVAERAPAGPAQALTAAPPPRRGEQVERPEGTFEVFTLSEGTSMKANLVGNPSLLRGCQFEKSCCTTQSFNESNFAVGVGTLGDTFEDSEGRFGEFLAAAGAVAYLPTDGTNVPDYFVPAGSSVANVQVCYAAAFQGAFAKMVRFESNKESGTVTLKQLAQAGLELAETEQLGMVMVAETDGLVGAALRRPPVNATSQNALFEFPEVRKWLTFTAERAYSRSLALVVGLVARGDAGAIGPLLRPLASSGELAGHFHAAAFNYRHLQKGEIDLKQTVRSLFENGSLQGVLHLLNDDRAMEGAGESEFVRGAIWLGPLA
jgi:anti-anti-sigma factor